MLLRIGSIGVVHIDNATSGPAIRTFRLVKIQHAKSGGEARDRGALLFTATDLDGKYFRFYDTNVVGITTWTH